MSNTVLLTFRQAVAEVTLNRPEAHHAVNAEMMERLEQVLDECEAHSQLRCIIFSATGTKTFCAGGDIKYFATLSTAESCKAMSRRMQTILNRFYFGKWPVIAAVNGQALGGGCEILTACHIRLAADHASFAFRQAPNGIITGWGGGTRLMEQMPRGQALRMLLSGSRFSADEALQAGLVEAVVPADSLMDECLTLAEKIAQNSAGAVEQFLGLSRLPADLSFQDRQQWELERFADLWIGPDFRNFIQNYLERR